MNTKQKILIVDDKKENLFALSQILRELDVEVVEATSGAEALSVVQEHEFSMAILDVQMPAMSGYELAKLLRKNRKSRRTPILFLTASYVDEEHTYKGYDAGAVDYIMKPCPPDILRGKVNAMLEISRYRNELEKSCNYLEILKANRAGKQKILIVDDRKENLVALRQVLRELDAEVIEATNGNDALAATLDNNFAVALLDVQMPGMSGYELAENLRGDKKTHMIPIVFLTANYGDEQHMFKGYEAGAVDYIVKPYQPGILRGKVKAFLEIAQNRCDLEILRDHLAQMVSERTESLRKERDFSRSLLDTAQTIVLALDTKGNIVSFNPYFQEISGYRLEDVKGRDWFSTFLPPEIRDSTRNLFLKAVDGIQTRGNVSQILTKDGRIREIEWYDKTMKDETGITIGLLATGQDITERKKAEQQLNMVLKHLEDAQRIGNIGSFKYDIGNNHVEWSNQMYLIFGVAPESEPLSYEKVLAMIHPEDRQIHQQQTQAIINKGFSFFEHRIIWKDGSSRWISGRAEMKTEPISGNRTLMEGTIQDITERKQAEEMLKDSESVKNKLISNIGDVIVIIDQNGMNKYKSPNVTKLFGWEPEELVGKNTWENVHPDDLVAGQQFFGKILAKPNANGTTEMRYKRKDGNYVWIEVSVVTLLHDKDIKGILGNYHDITERKQAEEEKVRLENQLSQSQKMEAVGQLAGGIAHDFNNMLSVINGYSELLLTGINSSDPKHAQVKEILKAGERSADLTRQLLAFARKQTIAPKVLDLNETITNMLKMLQRLIGENIVLSLNLATVFGIAKQNSGFIDVDSELGKGTTFRIYLPWIEQGNAGKIEKPENREILTGTETVLIVEDEPSLLQFARAMLIQFGYTVLTADSPGKAIKVSGEYKGEIHLLLTDVIMPEMSGREIRDKLTATRPGIRCLFMSGYTADIISKDCLLDKGIHFIEKPFTAEDLSRKLREALCIPLK